jgi:phage-related protein
VTGHRGDTWRSVYTVRFPDAVYVLHVFQKKSKLRIATPKKELDLIGNGLPKRSAVTEKGRTNHGGQSP